MKIQISNRYNGNVIFTTDAASLGAAVIAALARKANLSGADLSKANLSKANLSWANLSGADLSTILSQRTILEDGDIIGWKKLQGGVICKLKIPAEARRVGGLIGRKCRAEYAEVLEGVGESYNDSTFTYKPGTRVTPSAFDPNPLVECAEGIHFFVTRQEAENYNG